LKIRCLSVADQDSHDLERFLVIGETYTVYAITVSPDGLWYWVDLDLYEGPSPVAASFFEIVDGRVSASWVIGVSNSDRGPLTRIGWRQVAEPSDGFSRLYDSDSVALAAFKLAKEAIDGESALP
jgi:hypothetical protein